MNHRSPFSASLCRTAQYGLIAVIGCICIAPRANAASASEQANIEVMIRQLNALEDSARRSSHVADEPGQRYYFDYERLAGDIQRIRQGLQDYLTPSRAQPRDPAELTGDYTLSGGRMP
ncbi:type III effector Hop protein [Pseudomonas sp. RW407]|nr:RAQPRD family integrative conjugative element protein [Pseudomonas sp. RW407]PWU28659.1 type III effector Hop protein [Pseudomonas sp. RW407]